MTVGAAQGHHAISQVDRLQDDVTGTIGCIQQTEIDRRSNRGRHVPPNLLMRELRRKGDWNRIAASRSVDVKFKPHGPNTIGDRECVSIDNAS